MLVDYLSTVEGLGERVERLTASIVELVETWSLRPLVKAYQALRGVNVVTAAIIAAELGDLSRFARAPQLMGYLGLVPSEHSSGESRLQGRITRTGNGHVRRVLVEAAWAYRFRASRSRALRQRSQGVAPEIQKDRLACAAAALQPVPEADRAREEQEQDRDGDRPRARRLHLVHRPPAESAGPVRR